MARAERLRISRLCRRVLLRVGWLRLSGVYTSEHLFYTSTAVFAWQTRCRFGELRGAFVVLFLDGLGGQRNFRSAERGVTVVGMGREARGGCKPFAFCTSAFSTALSYVHLKFSTLFLLLCVVLSPGGLSRFHRA